MRRRRRAGCYDYCMDIQSSGTAPARDELPSPAYVVAVRTLCEFTARQGDLDLRYTPAPTAQEGQAGHVLVAGRRGDGYEAEIALSGDYGVLRVRGRADGYDRAANRLEEIKTHRGRLDALPGHRRALHWAQVRMYGHLLCRERGLTELELALVYLDVASRRETVLTERLSAAELEAFFNEQCERFLAWALAERSHRQDRDSALASLAFPYASLRTGQRELAVAAFRTARDGLCLMAQAPTGIGKTLGTLFPTLKACAAQRLDKIFFLTAKSSGRALALDAIDRLAAGAAGRLPLRTLELVARDKACEHPGRACHPDDCPLARGFYDRLAAARADAVAAAGRWDRPRVREIALSHGLCPYFLAQELARWSDVVVGDYNYYYDGNGLLYALTVTQGWRVAVLVDEAHNLVERARGMYSACVDQSAFQAALAAAPPALRRPLNAVRRQWSAWNRQQTAPYQCHPAVPAAWLASLQQATASITDRLAETPVGMAPALQRFYFDALHFIRLAEQFGSHSLFDVTLAPGRRPVSTLCLRNVVPASFLAPRHAAAHATLLFSGTLAPSGFYRDTLGLPASTGWMEVRAPFRPTQLSVRIAGHISTRFRDRERSVPAIAGLIVRQYAARPGNYLVFASSFDYVRRLAEGVREHGGQWPIWVQTPDMDEAGRAGFLARFVEGGQGLGFAVLGGAFAEGVDLPGSRLIGVFIATLGMPQVNPVNERMRDVMQARFGRGYDYTYLYPGLRKVVQAAGRVIRTEHDEGVLVLIDDRYGRPEVRQLFPAWWRVGPGADEPLQRR